MTYGGLKEQVLRLSFMYSAAGTEIPASYNNQADYLIMIPGLVNSAQFDIATSVRRIPAAKKLSELNFTAEGGSDVYTLPDDCWQIMPSGLRIPGVMAGSAAADVSRGSFDCSGAIPAASGSAADSHGVAAADGCVSRYACGSAGGFFRRLRICPEGKLEVPRGTCSDLILEYWRYPAQVTPATPDSTVLDNRPDVHECLVYYAAAGLLLYDDAYRAQMFRDEYERRKMALREQVWAEQGPVTDCYTITDC